jgi:antitoxin VapB
MMKAARPGKSVSQVFAEARAAYSRNGYPDEWQLHHQGGAVGYQPREYIATPECAETVLANQAFAWNPSVRGTKSEDTMLVREQGFELLTAPSPAWPAVVIEEGGEPIPRADILVR